MEVTEVRELSDGNFYVTLAFCKPTIMESKPHESEQVWFVFGYRRSELKTVYH